MTILKRTRIPALFMIVAVSLLVLATHGWPKRLAASAQGSEMTIAYVQADTRDEIRLIEPDGSNDRRLWGHDLADPEHVYEVWSLDWRPDGTELAFASTHENWCSINSSDIFAVGADGTGYRRMTQAPACDDLSSFPHGVVNVPVTDNAYAGFDGFIYLQGAPSLQRVSLAPGGSTVVTFYDVADLGDGVLQLAAMIVGVNREISPATAVDVQAGATVTSGRMSVYTPSGFWETRSPSWRSDGSKIGYALNFNSLLTLPASPAPLDLGEDLTSVDPSDRPDFIDQLTWGPASRANELLYDAEVWDFDEGSSENIFLVTEGSTTRGQRLLSFQVWENVMDLAWLPDGSGFVYSVIETDDTFEPSSANVFIYTFATHTPARLTEFDGEFAGMLSVSPDGEQIVFERGTALDESHTELADPDLWILNRDGTGLHLLVEDGRAPAWSPQSGAAPPPSPTPPPTPLAHQVFVPLIARGN